MRLPDGTLRGTVDCDRQCPIPDDFTLYEVPLPRHAWRDIIRCPYGDCERVFLVVHKWKNGPPNESLVLPWV